MRRRGISKVEVQLGEDSPWIEAELSEPLSVNSWIQWQVPWNAEPGVYQLQVRATDGDGVLQVERRSPAPPDGATGWHTRNTIVEEA